MAKGRRRHPRVLAEGLRAQVRAGEQTFECPVDDVSRGGAFLQTDKVLPVGSTIELIFWRGETPGLSFNATVARQVPGPDTLVAFRPGLGISFEGIGEAAEAELVEMLKSFGYTEAAPPPLPSARKPSSEEVPAAPPQVPPKGPRHDGDPFKEKAEPRIPRSGMPDEKLEYFRQMLQIKQEALARGRTAYAELVAEADQLHQVATALAGLLESASAKGEELRKRSVRAETEIEVARRDAEALREAARREAEELREATRRETKELRESAEAARKEAASAQRTKLELQETVATLEADYAQSRKLRDELTAANRKAMEAQASLNKERRQREELSARVAELERSAQGDAEQAKRASAALEAERDQLKESLAVMKKKLIVAEEALESALSRARLKKPASRT